MSYTSRYPTQDGDHVKATGFYNGEPYNCTDPTAPLTGNYMFGGWTGTVNTPQNQRFHIDLGNSFIIKRIYYENFHTSGTYTDRGVQNFTFWGSNTAGDFNDVTYANDGTWVQLTTSQSTLDQHVASDQADPKYITVTNDAAYRYYAFKCADDWGTNEFFLGIRRIELQTEDELVAGLLSEPLLENVEIFPADSGSSLGNCAITAKYSISLGDISSSSLADILIIGEGVKMDSTLILELPTLDLSLESISGTISTLKIVLPKIAIGLTSLPGTISEMKLSLPSLIVSMATTNNAILALTLPMLGLDAYGYGPGTSTLNLTLPMLELFAVTVRPGETVTCYALNTETGALSQYTNFSFNSFCEFNGHNLAASPSGIYLVEGEDDDGTDIDASFSPGINDFENAQLKRMGPVYLSFKGDGQCYLKITSDDGVQYEYLVESVGERTRTVKVKPGKGLKGRFFEIEIANIGGTDFEIQEMFLSVETLKRKVG
jgi:hypothetical protein